MVWIDIMPDATDKPIVLEEAALRLLSAGIAAGVPGMNEGTPLAIPAHIDWTGLQMVARQGKLLTLVLRGFDRIGIEVDPAFRRAAQGFRREALAVNAVNLSALGRTAAILDQAGLSFVLFKGPLQQQMIYGDHFIRPSTDIDILVPEAQFDRASAAFLAKGYDLPGECRTPWWRHFLGEQHFFASEGRGATLDLHHRVQQPGCPAPRHLSDYLSDVTPTSVGQAVVPMMSRANTALLCCISTVKAVIRREPAAIYLCDLSAIMLAMLPDERAALTMRAERQGLLNTLRFAIRCAERLLSLLSLEGLPPALPTSCMSDADVPAMLLTPRSPYVRWPRLRRILWELSDTSGPGGKFGTYIIEGANQLAAKACKSWYHRRALEALDA